jgi:hypothetical protein
MNLNQLPELPEPMHHRGMIVVCITTSPAHNPHMPRPAQAEHRPAMPAPLAGARRQGSQGVTTNTTNQPHSRAEELGDGTGVAIAMLDT